MYQVCGSKVAGIRLLSVYCRSLRKLACFVRAFASLPCFDLTEDDIQELPKLSFSGNVAVINSPMDEKKYSNEIKEIQNAGTT